MGEPSTHIIDTDPSMKVEQRHRISQGEMKSFAKRCEVLNFFLLSLIDIDDNIGAQKKLVTRALNCVTEVIWEDVCDTTESLKTLLVIIVADEMDFWE